MAKIKFNYSVINQRVFPSYTKAMDQLQEAKRISQNFVIPAQFKYRSYLWNLTDQLNQNIQQVQQAHDTLVQYNRMIDQALMDAKYQLDGIDQIRLTKRGNMIKR